MAIVPATMVKTDDGYVVVTWEDLTAADQGAPVSVGEVDSLTAQLTVAGTAPTVTMQGSSDGVAWGTLQDPEGADVADLAAITQLELIGTKPKFIRPDGTGSGAGSNTVMLTGAQRR